MHLPQGCFLSVTCVSSLRFLSVFQLPSNFTMFQTHICSFGLWSQCVTLQGAGIFLVGHLGLQVFWSKSNLDSSDWMGMSGRVSCGGEFSGRLSPIPAPCTPRPPTAGPRPGRLLWLTSLMQRTSHSTCPCPEFPLHPVPSHQQQSQWDMLKSALKHLFDHMCLRRALRSLLDSFSGPKITPPPPRAGHGGASQAHCQGT